MYTYHVQFKHPAWSLDAGEYSKGKEIRADNDEEAIQKARALFEKRNRRGQNEIGIRILKLVHVE